jgi:hypothetical protein
MQSLEHRALAQTARTQFKERQQSMARFHPGHRPTFPNPVLRRLPCFRGDTVAGVLAPQGDSPQDAPPHPPFPESPAGAEFVYL